MRSAILWSVAWLAGGCGAAAPAGVIEAELSRSENVVDVRSTRDGEEWVRARFELFAHRSMVVATATLAGGSLSFEASASLPRFAFGRAVARSDEVIDLGGRRALFDGVAYPLDDAGARAELAA